MNEISTSKTMKRMAIKKNFMQNGTWFREVGSKPHSYEESSSWEKELVRGRKDKDRRTRTTNKQKKK